MPNFAFAFYLTHWNEDLLGPFEVCLKSLEFNGEGAANYPRYLIFSGELTPRVHQFCERNGLKIISRPLWIPQFRLPNRTLVCSAPAHDVVCLIDTDIVFLSSPTPMFEQSQRTGKVLSRIDISLPYTGFTAKWKLEWLARWIWLRQFSRFAPHRSLPPLLNRPGGGKIPPYFNGGVHFVPGPFLERLGQTWQRICSRLYRDNRFYRPYTFLFNSYYFEMLSYALALHAADIPWSPLPATHNFMPVPFCPAEDRFCDQAEVTMLHLVREVRYWLDLNTSERDPQFAYLQDRVQGILRQMPLSVSPS